MEIFDSIKNNSGWFIIPFTWIAYYMDFGVSHLMIDKWEGPFTDIVFIGLTVITILLVGITLMLAYTLVTYVALFSKWNFLSVSIAVVLLTFGVLGLFKEVNDIPFKEINIFWHLSSLSIAFWLFSEIDRVNYLLENS